MAEFFAYHVVTERPMALGQVIKFDENHHSGVYQRVMNKLDTVNEIYSNSKKYKGITLEHHTSVALRELALEEIRKEKYQNYPSRLSCLYVVDTLEEAESWYDYFASLGRPVFQIVKLKINGRRFVGNAENCFDATSDKKTNMALAEKYWQNHIDENTKPVIEVLADGIIEIIEIVKPSP